MEKRSFGIKIVILIAISVAVFLFSFFIGRFPVGPITTLKILLSKIVPIKQTWTDAQFSTVINIRLPRIACAALVGAALSVAGAAYQGMFRNPMASPDILGASTGAGFGASLAILFGASYFIITVSSFVFGLIAVLLAFVISKASKIQTTVAMVLSGIIVGSLFQSGTGFIKLVADTERQLPAITYWLMGSLVSVKPADLLFALIPILLGLVPICLLSWRMNLLTVSEIEAKSMGVETDILRFIVVVCATLMTSASVAISGMIGWVGLVVPHFCRLLFDEDYRHLIPASAIMGSTFLMIVDDLARVASSSEIPLGILTSLIGAPVFIFLIITGGHSDES